MNETAPTAPITTLYEVLGEIVEPRTDPDTIETKQIETIDNDYATTLLGGFGI